MIVTQISPDVHRADLSPRQVEREFGKLITGGARFSIAGLARSKPELLLSGGQLPKHKIALFDTTFYLTNVRQMPELRFFVSYVVQPTKTQASNGARSTNGRSSRLTIYPRIFYKDLSLVWRSASHFSYEGDDFWIGKGDVRSRTEAGFEWIESDEATTDLPLEMQSALESLLDWSRGRPGTPQLIGLVLRESPGHRVHPYRDFLQPRIQASSNPGNLINAGQPIATFKRKNDPASLEIVRGYEPDFKAGVVAKSTSTSQLYGGQLRRFRILSTNRQVQYYFIAAKKHDWIFPPQALTTELSSYGVRTISVVADDDLFLAGYEYHYFENTPEGRRLYSQIPPGFAGETCDFDPAKADTSKWLDQIPLIQEFRSRFLGRG